MAFSMRLSSISILPSADTFLLTLFNSKSGIIGIRFHLVKLADVVNRLCGQRPVFFQGIHVLPSDMCPTADQSDPFHPLKLFVSRVAVTLHNAMITSQQFTGYHTRTAAAKLLFGVLQLMALLTKPRI